MDDIQPRYSSIDLSIQNSYQTEGLPKMHAFFFFFFFTRLEMAGEILARGPTVSYVYF